MNIVIEELEPCKLSVHYEANALEIMDKRAEVQNAFRKAPVPGFREGRASMDAIRIHYRQQIEDSLKRALAEDAYHNTLFEKKLRAHGAPKFNNLLLDGGKFTCEFELFTKPDFELAPYKELEIPKPAENGENAQEMTEKMLQELRVRLGDVASYSDTDFVQMGDNVIVDYEGTLDGKEVPGLVNTGEMVTIGTNNIPDFDSNLLGMAVGETREFDIHAPAESLPSIAGKTVHFKVTLTTGAKTTPCPLNDELATRMGKKDFAELREQVSAAAVGRVQSAAKMAMHNAVAKRLIADNTINVPNWMALSEAQYLAHQSQLDWTVVADADKEKFLEMATGNVKLSLILDKVREEEVESQLSDQEVFEIIKQNLMKTKVQKPLDDVIQEMNRTGYLQILFARIRDEHTMDYVVKSVKVLE